MFFLTMKREANIQMIKSRHFLFIAKTTSTLGNYISLGSSHPSHIPKDA